MSLNFWVCGAHFWRPVKARLKEKEGKLEKMCIVNPWLGLYIVCITLFVLVYYYYYYYYYFLFYLLFGCVTANFGSFSRGQPH